MTLLVFLIVLGLLVFVHELGHFLVAKKTGMKVEEFGFGFPPRVVGFWRKGGKWSTVVGPKQASDPDHTIYSINLIPLGGFVRILGENNSESGDGRSFINRPFFSRFATLIAGVCMNALLAWVLLSGGYMLGIPRAVGNGEIMPHNAKIENRQVVIAAVLPHSPAETAGLLPGDVVTAIDGQAIHQAQQLQEYIKANSGNLFVFDVKRDVATNKISVQSDSGRKEVGPTGIQLAEIGIVKVPVHIAIIEGAKDTYGMGASIISGLWKLFHSSEVLSSLGGPVEIARYTGQAARLGLPYILQFTAFLSVNLAILNILPIPALDGGRILFLLIEKVRGKKMNARVEQYANTLGFALLLLLMIVVTVKDISKL